MYKHTIELPAKVHLEMASENETLTEDEVGAFVASHGLTEDAPASLAHPIMDGHMATLFLVPVFPLVVTTEAIEEDDEPCCYRCEEGEKKS